MMEMKICLVLLPVLCSILGLVKVVDGGTEWTVCDASNWPDLDHGLVCGDCKALIDKMNSKYITCNNYCQTIGRSCSGAWEESGDSCTVMSIETCAHKFTYTSDAICQCGPTLSSDLPILIWNDPYNINIKFPNGKEESIQLILVSDLENACVLEGETSETSLIITSPSSSDGCHSLNKHSEITLRSTHLQKKTASPIQKIKAIYSMKNGKLQEIDEHIFGINEEGRKRDVSKMEAVPKKIQMPIQFGYDLGLLNKFNKYGQGKSYIRKRIQQLFLASKMSLNHILNQAKFELILEKNIIYIDEELKMRNSVLLKSRKYQFREDIPIIILCAEDYENNIKGLSFRSGACRKDKERYGVAMMVWRDDGGLAADVLEHEIGHLIGGVHNHNEKNAKETDVGHSNFNSDNVHFWFNVSGSRCYGKLCSHPPNKPHGSWSCDKEYHRCDLKCDPGFATVFSNMQCENGKWSDSINNIGCSPSVLLLVGGDGAKRDIEVYDPTTGSVSCTNLLPSLDLDWSYHTSFTHHGTVYMCGGHNTEFICIHLDSQLITWRKHNLVSPRYRGHSSIVMDNTLFLIGGIDINWDKAEAVSTPLPLTDKPVLNAVPNLSYKGERQCTVKIDQDRFAIIGGYNGGYLQGVTRYNIVEGKIETLSPIGQARSDHGCVMLEVDTKLWIIVTGGQYQDGSWKDIKYRQTTEVLDITDGGNVWKFKGNLNVARQGHGMAVTERGVMIMGGMPSGWTSLQSVEVLDWTSGEWKLIEQSLTKARGLFGGVVEIPAELFGCGAQSITRDTNADCSLVPSKQNGKWSCDATNTKCSLICDPGFVSLYTTTTCSSGGIWKEINKIECLPSVLLLAGGYGDQKNIEAYNPTTGHVSCSNQPPPLDANWYSHTSFTHHGTVYMCGGVMTVSICISFDSQLNTWRNHALALPRQGASSIVMDNTLFLIGGQYNSGGRTYSGTAVSTPLPLTETPVATAVPNLSFKGDGECTVKIDKDSFAITGGGESGLSNDVTRYNIVDGTTETLSPMQQRRKQHGCVLLEVDTKLRIIVTGGLGDNRKTTEVLNITEIGNAWNYMENLNVGRGGHSMAVTERGVVAMGGMDSSFNMLKSVELLNWTSGQWKLIEQSLTKARSLFGGVVEIPAQLFGCQTQSIGISDCDGEYKYNQEFVGGKAVDVPEDQTCHSICENENDCKAWTWTAQDQCRISENEKSLETIKPKTGSISGLKNSCKPKCYRVLGPQEEVSTNTQFCTETGCSNMIHMEPDDFQEGDTILVCHELQEDGKSKRVCESISYKQVHLVCNPQPATVTLQSWKNVGKHDRHFRDARSMFSNWGRRPPRRG